MTKEDARLTLQENLTYLSFEHPGRITEAIKVALEVLSKPVEHTRTDVFIEKACEWLKNNVTYTHPRTGETKCVVNLNAFIDAMKGE